MKRFLSLLLSLLLCFSLFPAQVFAEEIAPEELSPQEAELLLPEQAEEEVQEDEFSYEENFAAMQPGWNSIEGRFYYCDELGNPLRDTVRVIDDQQYYFYPDGHMAVSEEVNGVYYDENGYGQVPVLCGQVPFLWLRYPDGSYAQSKFDDVNGERYYFLDSSYAATEWVYLDGWYYYFDKETSVMLTGEQIIDGVEYYFHPDGRMAQDEEVNGKFYDGAGARIYARFYGDPPFMWYKYEDGSYPVSEWKIIDGNTYYFQDSAYCAVGWLYLDGVYYYFDEQSCIMQTGEQTVNGAEYYFYPDGHMAQDEEVNGKFYDGSGARVVDSFYGEPPFMWYKYADGSYPVSEWKLIDGNTYYFQDSSYAAVGWLYLEGYYYYFDEQSCIMQTGEKTINGVEYYFYPDGHMAQDEEVNGKFYDGSGARRFDSLQGEVPYLWYQYADGSYPVAEFKTVDGNTYYFQDSSYAAVGWLELGGYYYYFDESTSVMQTGAQSIGGSDYYFHADGRMAVNETIDGFRYGESGTKIIPGIQGELPYIWYQNPDGSFLSDSWKNVDGNIYFFAQDGYAATGFWDIDGETYYFDPDTCIMHTGWLRYGGYDYYFFSDGTMAVNTWIDEDNYFGSDGRRDPNARITPGGRLAYYIMDYGYYNTDGNYYSVGDSLYTDNGAKVMYQMEFVPGGHLIDFVFAMDHGGSYTMVSFSYNVNTYNSEGSIYYAWFDDNRTLIDLEGDFDIQSYYAGKHLRYSGTKAGFISDQEALNLADSSVKAAVVSWRNLVEGCGISFYDLGFYNY